MQQNLEQLRQIQKDCFVRGPKLDTSEMQRVAGLQQELFGKMDVLRQQLEHLRAHVLLLPLEISLLNQFLLESSLQLKQLQLYQVELEGYMQNKTAQAFVVPAALVITQQPFPKSVKQNKPVDDGLHVRLLTGAACSIWPTEQVFATIVTDANPPPVAVTASGRPKKASARGGGHDSSHSAANQQFSVLNNQRTMDNNCVVFDALTFPQGSRKRTLNLKFAVTVNCSRPVPGLAHAESYTCLVESDISQPFIVKTNENQWDEAEGSLLKAEAFGNKADVSWFQLCNALQRRYLMATKQDLHKPSRPLTPQDFNYLYALKFGRPDAGGAVIPNEHTLVSVKSYDAFWQWFGPGLHKVRYQRHLCALWQQGYICGFLKRDEADKVLTGAPLGSFLIRLSDRVGGNFAIAYVAYEEGKIGVSHYLISENDVFGPKKTLPDFLGSAKSLMYITQVLTDPDSGNRIYRICDKEIALHDYFSKRSNDSARGPNPYDEVLKS